MEIVKMKFKDAPIGARFKLPNGNLTWVKINSNMQDECDDGNGLICQWNGNIKGFQNFCSFVDERNGIDYDTKIELL